MEKETVKIADKQVLACRHLKLKQQITLTKSYAWKILRLKFSDYFSLVMLEF